MRCQRLGLLLSVLIAALGLVGGPTEPAWSAGVLTIVSAEHDPGGHITAALAVAGASGQLQNVTALVDGIVRPAEVTQRPNVPASIVIAIDTSGSMAGQPIEAARAAAGTLIQRLAPDDQIAVVAFSDAPRVVSPFGAPRSATQSALKSLTASGNTALYAALDESLRLLTTRSADRRVLVLLSDGEDHGTATGASGTSQRREASLVSLGGGATRLYAVAFGGNADTTFLREAANRSGGDVWPVADGAALGALFSHLGDRLGASSDIRVTVPPLSRGAHTLELRAVLGGQPVTVNSVIPVTNQGLLRAAPRDVTANVEGMLVVALGVPPHSAGLRFSATAGGQALPLLDQPPRVLVDPWRFAPGALTVEVSGSLAGEVIASTTVPLTVPELTPQLTLAIETIDGSPYALARGRVQGRPDARIELLRNAEVIGAGALPEFRMPVSNDEASLTARIVAGEQTLLSAVFAAPAASSEFLVAQFTIVAMAAMAILAFVLLYRSPRREQSHGWRPRGRTFMVGGRVPSGLEVRQTRGTLVVRGPEGAERRYDIRRGPLSLGSSPDCDVVIADGDVASVHARLYALDDGDFRVHGIAPRVGRPFLEQRTDEWMLLHHGEQIAIGSHVLTVLAATKAGGEGVA